MSAAPYFINYQEYLNVGLYRVRMETAENTVLEQNFEVVDDPQEH